MTLTRRAAVAALLTLAIAPALAQEKVDLKVVKYDGLARIVGDLKGKVVVVDLWAFS